MKKQTAKGIQIFVAVLTSVTLVGLFGGYWLTRNLEAAFLKAQERATRQITTSLGHILSVQLSDEAETSNLLESLQTALEGSQTQAGFVCLLDQNGRVAMHPNPEMIGMSRKEALTMLLDGAESGPMGELLKTEDSFVRLIPHPSGKYSEIVYSQKIPNSDLFICAHANPEIMYAETARIKRTFWSVSALLGLVLAVLVSVTVWHLTRGYERRIESANEQLEHQVQERTEELKTTLDDLRKAHHQLIQGEKMTVLGELTSGIAHELNNPLQVISGRADLLEIDAESPEQVRNHAEAIQKNVTRAASIVKNLLSFTRSQTPQVAPAWISEIIRSAVELIQADLIADKIKLECRLPENLPSLVLDQQQIEQVLLNVLNNARQSLREHPGDRHLTLSARSEEHHFRIDVQDSGPGVAKEMQKHLFDPFETTKASGTGLGLSLCRRFMEAHGGSIELIASDVGAHFRIILPLNTPDLEELNAHHAPSQRK